jgi:hypothetical protein
MKKEKLLPVPLNENVFRDIRDRKLQKLKNNV